MSGAVDVVATRRVAFELAVEGGYVALATSARANGIDAVAIEGPWLGVQLGVGILP